MKELGYETVIDNIKRIISEKGMKQCTVAERAGFSKSEFSNILNGRRKLLRVEHMMRIACALEVDVNTLYYPPRNTEERGEGGEIDENRNGITRFSIVSRM